MPNLIKKSWTVSIEGLEKVKISMKRKFDSIDKENDAKNPWKTNQYLQRLNSELQSEAPPNNTSETQINRETLSIGN